MCSQDEAPTRALIPPHSTLGGPDRPGCPIRSKIKTAPRWSGDEDGTRSLYRVCLSVSQLPARPHATPRIVCLTPPTSYVGLPRRNWRLWGNQGYEACSFAQTACVARTEPTGPVLRPLGRPPVTPAPLPRLGRHAPHALSCLRVPPPGNGPVQAAFGPSRRAPISILSRDRQAALPSGPIRPPSSQSCPLSPFHHVRPRRHSTCTAPVPVDRSPEASRPHTAYNAARVTGRRPGAHSLPAVLAIKSRPLPTGRAQCL